MSRTNLLRRRWRRQRSGRCGWRYRGHCSEGDTVEAGQTVVVLEAMKMEHALKAGISGTGRL